jgi:hypothetical protein
MCAPTLYVWLYVCAKKGRSGGCMCAPTPPRRLGVNTKPE